MKYEKGGGDGSKDNSDGPMGIEMRHPRDDIIRSARESERQANRAAARAERTATVEGWKKLGKKILAILIASGAIATLALGGKERIPGESLPQDKWEEAMRNRTAGHNATITYGEDGSTITFVDDHTGEQTSYFLEDLDNDTYIERGHSSNSKGSADFGPIDSHETGMPVEGAISYLDNHME